MGREASRDLLGIVRKPAGGSNLHFAAPTPCIVVIVLAE